MKIVFIIVATIAISFVLHTMISRAFNAARHFQRKKLFANTLGIGLIFTVLTECGSVGIEYASTGNLSGAIISRSISFFCSLFLAGLLVCYIDWFYHHKRQIWDEIKHPWLRKYVETTVCALIVWGCMSSIKLSCMYAADMITAKQAGIMFSTSLGTIVFGAGNLVMQALIEVKKRIANGNTPSEVYLRGFVRFRGNEIVQ